VEKRHAWERNMAQRREKGNVTRIYNIKSAEFSTGITSDKH
jgi:hypothetical protein